MSTIEKAMAKLKKGDSDANTNPESHSGIVSEDDSGQAENATPVDAAEQAKDSQPEATVRPESPVQSTGTQDEAKSSGYETIDISRLKSKGYLTPDSDNRVLKEQYRSIKRKLLSNAFGPISKTLHFPNLIIVTSCNPHEGKTFSSINLALSIALEQDKTVLLVDSDVVRPNICRQLGLENGAGLTEFLAGMVDDVSEIIFNTNIPNFKFIPAGTPHELSTELLGSAKMKNLTKELATRYPDRVVIFDAPPLLGVNETHVMANLVGQAVVVVEENKTSLNDIQMAVGQLDNKLAIGYLVNKSRGSYRDYYGYGYYYHQDKIAK